LLVLLQVQVAVAATSKKAKPPPLTSKQTSPSATDKQQQQQPLLASKAALDKAQKRREEISLLYNLSKARKKGAVNEALDFLIAQEDLGSAFDVSKLKSNTSSNELLPVCADTKSSSCPVCSVTINAIMNEGTFVFLGNTSTLQPPYSHTCWSMRVRYHVAPACEEEEQQRGVQPAWSWKWTLRSALEGRCVMPSFTPPAAAKAFRKDNVGALTSSSTHTPAMIQGSTETRREESSSKDIKEKSNDALKKKKEEKEKKSKPKPVVVLMLGLSFMGQPFMSMGCQFADMVVGGEADAGKGRVSVESIRENGGQWTGYKQSEIDDFYPPLLHDNKSTMMQAGYPRQNVEECSMDHALIKFATTGGVGGSGDGVLSRSRATTTKAEKKEKEEEEEAPEMWVCYIYTFNIPKNIKKNHPLPCNLTSWQQIDIVLSIPNHSNILLYMKRTGAGNLTEAAISHVRVLNIMPIYESMIYQQLQASEAFKQHGSLPFRREDFQAKFKKCGFGKEGGADVHYRMPGIVSYICRYVYVYI